MTMWIPQLIRCGIHMGVRIRSRVELARIVIEQQPGEQRGEQGDGVNGEYGRERRR
jgi:hypothetical protein